jgi:hypothetical protein
VKSAHKATLLAALALGLAPALAACATPPPPTEEPATAMPPTSAPPTPAPPTAADTTGAAAGNAGPAVQVVALQEGTMFVEGQEVGVAVLAADSDGIKSAGLTINGEVVDSLEGSAGPIFQGTLTWTPTAPGPYTAAVVVYDNNDQVGYFQARQVLVVPATPPAGATAVPTATATPTGDVSAPAVSITPMETTVTAGSDVDVAVNAVDEAGVVQLDLYVDGTVQDSWTYDPASGPAPQSAFETLTWRNSTSGQHTVWVTATDSAGNVGKSVEEKVTVNE